MTRLERRYRWLLSWYPPEYRLAYEEEMVGVLMAGAQPQQQRPSWRESMNLAWNASLARLGHHRRTVHDGRWHTASAVFGLLGALVLLTDQLRQAVASHGWSDKYMSLLYNGPAPQRWVIAGGWVVAVVCLLLGWRHSAALAAWFAALFQAVWLWIVGSQIFIGNVPREWWWQAVLTISVVVALSVATRSVRAASVIGGRWITVIAVLALLGAGLELAFALRTEFTYYDEGWIGISPGITLEWHAGVGVDFRELLLAILVSVVVARLSAPLRRRVVAMFAPTTLMILLGWLVWGRFGALQHEAGPPALLLLLAAIATFLTSLLVVRLLDRREQRVLADPVSST